MFRFIKKNTIEYLEATVLSTHDFLCHAFCTRRGGISEGNFFSLNFSSREGDSIDNVRQNWRILAKAFNIEVEQFFVVNQVHGNSILIIDHTVRDFISHQSLQYDAIITDLPGVAIGIKTADCVPIFFVDKVKHIVGVAHAGWKGTALNIGAKVVDTFLEKFSSHVDDIIAAIGPAIGPCCYQVGELVYHAMEPHNNREHFFCPCSQEGRWFLDLPLANELQIASKGIKRTHIYSAHYCTSCNTGIFYSHRGEGKKTGRQLNFIMLK
ncbi:MAG: peptidoglycan editing factor PgeF [Deltaproteobacteria bacterium]|nr:peptidoglycan editing factor PgeF [Deltaproteobacteria bacterium]